MKLISIKGQPILDLFTSRDIAMHEELRYDYGRNNLPWISQISQPCTSEERCS